MKYKRFSRRLFSLLTLLAILLPIISLSAYAATSPRTAFDFLFNGGPSSMSVLGTKRDIGESSAGAAGVTVIDIVVSVGRVEFWINNTQNKTITSESLYVDSTGTGTLYYKMSELNMLPNPASVRLYGAPIGTIWSCSGLFQP